MAIILFKAKTYSDADYVDGIFRRDRKMENALHKHCLQYFEENYRGVFFANDEDKTVIFHESFVQLWRNIENRKLYVEDGILKGKDGVPFQGKLTTYFMGIAKLKYLEIARERNNDGRKLDLERVYNQGDKSKVKSTLIAMELDLFRDILYGEEKEMQLEAIAYCISHISKRCNQILTKYWYEEKTYDEILEEMPTFSSKNALKTAKYKCMENLRKTANDIYYRYLND